MSALGEAGSAPHLAPLPRARSSRAALWLLLAPSLSLVASAIAPRIELGAAAATVATFVGGMLVALLPLTLAARGALSRRAAIATASASAVLLVAAAIVGVRGALSAAAVNAALVAMAHAAGGGVGRRVEHPGHLLPAAVVAAAADFVSVVHPMGPTHAVAQSERALSVLAIGFPVPGTRAVAPVVGVGDLLFVALVLGVVVAHELSIARAAILAVVGLAAAGALSATLEQAVPALLPIGAAIVAGIPAARTLRAKDRQTARLAMTMAGAIAAAVLLQRVLF